MQGKAILPDLNSVRLICLTGMGARTTQYVAVITDIIGSRKLPSSQRRTLQRRLEGLIEQWNHDYSAFLAAAFVITTGDEFQALFTSTDCVVNWIWDMETNLSVDVRIGIGRGALTTDLRPVAIGMDGPVWHSARHAIELAHANAWLGGVFNGFGESEDQILNGLARLTRRLRETMTARQKEVIGLLREGTTQTDVAHQLGITKQSVHEHVVSAGWNAYAEGEVAWKQFLEFIK